MQNFKEKYGPWALVTGTNSGIGKAIATELAERGLNIVAVGRNTVELERLAVEWSRQYKVEVLPVTADLTRDDAVDLIASKTSDLDIGLVVPNAGIAISGDFIDTDLDSNISMLRLNIETPVRMAHLFGARLAARGSGGILLISSLFGYQGMPLVANYSATKAYILSFGEALNNELGRQGVDVTVLSPGLTDTNMPKNMPLDFSKLPMFYMAPKRVAHTGIEALGRKATVVPGLLNKIYAWENRLIPRSWPVSLFGFLLRRAFIKPTPAPSTEKLKDVA